MSRIPQVTRRARWVGPLWRWHRRAGLVAALLLLVLAITGLLLNHSVGLGLDQRRVTAGWLRALYSHEPEQPGAFAAAGHWVAQGGDGELMLGAGPAGPCEGRLVGAREWQGMMVVACEHELVLLAADGARIDALGTATGLDETITALGSDPDRLSVRTGGGQWRLFDADAMRLGAEAPADRAVEPSEPPAELTQRLREQGGWLTWERLLLDLHSGRLFGRFGVLAMDVAGVLAIVLSLSGVLIWGLRRRSPRKESRHA